MPIADRDVVRKLAGNRSVATLTDAEVDNAISFADTFVKTRTQKQDWTEGVDVDYDAVKKAAEYFAAAEILSRFKDEEGQNLDAWDRGMEILDAVIAHLQALALGDPGGMVTIVSGEYKTHPMNPNAPYRRPGGLGDVYSEGMEPLQ